MGMAEGRWDKAYLRVVLVLDRVQIQTPDPLLAAHSRCLRKVDICPMVLGDGDPLRVC